MQIDSFQIVSIIVYYIITHEYINIVNMESILGRLV